MAYETRKNGQRYCRLTIEPPTVGDIIEGSLNSDGYTYDINIRPEVTIPGDVDYFFRDYEVFWTVSGEYDPYFGKIESGESYMALLRIYGKDREYQFPEEGLTVSVNDEEIKEDEEFFNIGEWVDIYYPMKAVEKTCTITFDLNGGTVNEEHPLQILTVPAGSTFIIPFYRCYHIYDINH